MDVKARGFGARSFGVLLATGASVVRAAVVATGACIVATGAFATGCRHGAAAGSHGAAPPSAPPSGSGLDAAATSSAHAVDRALHAAWSQKGIVPSRPVDDAGFLRRVTLDIAGRIPTIEEAEAFARDPADARRARAVERLSSSPAYADRWTNYWDDVLIGEDVRKNIVDKAVFRGWLHAELEGNAPYDRMVFELITSTGVNRDTGGADDSAAATDMNDAQPSGGMQASATMSSPSMLSRRARADRPRRGHPTEPVNGAVNWLLKYQDSPQDLAGNVASTFLGVKIQCAQCHDHKTEKWKQQDFIRFTACFMRTQGFPIELEKGGGGPKRIQVVDVPKAPPKFTKMPELEKIAEASPAALDGTDFSGEPNRREALASWITSRKNPWFAKAIVNRMWGELLGHGFVEPVDDFRASNPALLPELLDSLAADFVGHGYDLKYLLAVITKTEAYQLASEPATATAATAARSTAPAPTADPHGPPLLWSRFPLKPLAPDQLLDSIAVAVGADATAMARVDFADAKAQLRKQFSFLFDIDETSHDESYEGTIPQALLLMNARRLGKAMTAVREWARSSAAGDDEAVVKTLFRRTLGREPTTAEHDRLVGLVGGAGPGKRGETYEDIFWALMNSSEFVFNH